MLTRPGETHRAPSLRPSPLPACGGEVGAMARYWRSYGDDPLPTPDEALAAPLSAFPSWFLRMECERCGAERYTNQVHMSAIWQDATVREVFLRLHHEGCGGLPKVVEFVDAIAGSG